MKSGAVPYFRLLNKNSIEVRALLGSVLRDAGVPSFNEAVAQAHSRNRADGRGREGVQQLFKAGALTEDEFKAAKERILG